MVLGPRPRQPPRPQHLVDQRLAALRHHAHLQDALRPIYFPNHTSIAVALVWGSFALFKPDNR